MKTNKTKKIVIGIAIALIILFLIILLFMFAGKKLKLKIGEDYSLEYNNTIVDIFVKDKEIVEVTDENKIIAKKVGTTTLKIEFEDGTKKKVKIKILPNVYKVKFIKNDQITIDYEEKQCYITELNQKCSIITSNISTEENVQIYGWATDKNATTKEFDMNSKIEIGSDMTLYAVTYSPEKTVKVTFEKNGAIDISKTIDKCVVENVYNGETEDVCSITLPNISQKNPDEIIIGWSTDKNATTKEYDVNSTIEVNKNMTLYAITYEPEKTYTVTFEKNGSNGITKTTESCTIGGYNDQKKDKCEVELADITKVNKNDKVIGWSTNKNATTKEYDVNSTIEINEDMTLYAITYSPEKKITVTFEKNGAKSITKESTSCTIGGYNGKNKNKCEITLADITKKTSNEEVIGWSTNKNATKKEYDVNSKIQISKDITLYAITYEPEKIITVTFNKNGAKAISKTKESCTTGGYNGQKKTKCEIALGDITKNTSDEKIIGWSTNKNATTKEYTVKSTIEITSDITLYAITYQPEEVITVTFVKNGAKAISKTTESCTIGGYNSQKKTKCDVTLADITKRNLDEKIIGWSTNKNATTKEYDVNSAIKISKDMTLYAITYQPEKTYTVTFAKNGAKSITKTTESCTIGGVYNTATQATTCEVSLGDFEINSVGSYDTIVGWSTDKNATKKEYDVNSKITIEENKTLYAIYKHKKYIRFYFNSAKEVSDKNIENWTVKDDYLQKSIFVYNSQSVDFATPSIISTYTGNIALGFSKTKTSTTADVSAGSNIRVNATDEEIINYYAIVEVSNPLEIYMSPNGSSSNDGLSKNSSVATLTDVYNIIQKYYKSFGSNLKDINIYIESGTYFNESTTWSFTENTFPDYKGTINIQGVGTKPIFMGNGQTSFLIIKGNNTAKFNIKNIQINKPNEGGYNNGITLRNINNSIIENVDFYRIGDYYTDNDEYSYGAIRAFNSSNNKIYGCIFQDIQNKKGSYLVHAIYLINDSSKNKIYENEIINCKPDPIRVRNNSNNNAVYKNTFKNSGVYSYMSVWYNINEEKPAIGNSFYENKLYGRFVDSDTANKIFNIIELFEYYPDKPTEERTVTYVNNDHLKEYNNVIY